MVDHKKHISQSSRKDIDAFVKKAGELKNTRQNTGKLLFALDATASRQPTWDHATHVQYAMFDTVQQGLLIQLMYFRGQSECRSSRWVDHSDQLKKLMQLIHCQAGLTQIKRVLEHAIDENKKSPIAAVVYIGDCVEEPEDKLYQLAGQARLHQLPIFIFQEGSDPQAQKIFSRIADLSGGAYTHFDLTSAQTLRELLSAAASYAKGGKMALVKLAAHNPQAARLIEQLD